MWEIFLLRCYRFLSVCRSLPWLDGDKNQRQPAMLSRSVIVIPHVCLFMPRALYADEPVWAMPGNVLAGHLDGFTL